MDLITLSPITYKPDADAALIEGYDSLIWTERYLAAGDFQLIAYNGPKIKRLLPIGTLVSLLDTREVMIVESHVVSYDDEGNQLLTTKGRSVETFGEQRVIPGNSGLKIDFVKEYSSVGAVEVLLFDAFVNKTDYYKSLGGVGWPHNPNDALPNVKISESTHPGQEVKQYQFEPGYVYPYILNYLDRDDLGIRSLRPNTDSATIVTSISPSSEGTINRETQTDIQQLLIDIYDGVDRTLYQSNRNRVVFRADLGQVVNPAYLFTMARYKNVGAWATTEQFGLTDRWRSNTPPYDIVDAANQVSGWDRRVMFFDYEDKWTNRTTTQQDDEARGDMKDKLSRRKRKLWFDGELSPLIPDKFGKQYFLGDKVTLQGADYDVDATAVVTEYIRTVDQQNGEKGYPTLEVKS